MSLDELKVLIEGYILEACRDTIQDLGLIDTGALLNSFKVEVDDELNINIFAEDYYEYLDEGTRYIEPFNITEEILQHDLYIKAELLIEDYFVSIIDNLFD